MAITKLGRSQKFALSAASGCMTATLTAAMEIALEIVPRRPLRTAGLTDCHQTYALRSMEKKPRQYTHSYSKQGDRVSFINCSAAPCDRIANQHIFNRKYHAQMREEEHDQSTLNVLRIYTNGSRTGCDIFSLNLSVNIHIS
ncbi:unnamed protein product [Pieris macdunnoughi]|uniref:Uncharacterized protein n=1 Tax=Pieris macdunnoughi TaxID=345717 RepID=A0A821RLC5_9NEOP|nr:unnamed protein product [Pieris macdunnoughi]